MGWNNDYTLLTAPISLGDISRATGVGGPPYDLGNMASRGALNKWAKWQQFSMNALYATRFKDAGSESTVSASARLTNPLAGIMSRMWGFYPISSSLTLGNPGIKLYSGLTSINNPLKTDLDNYGAGEHWRRELPSGRPTDWFRALDYDGYTSECGWALGSQGSYGVNIRYGFPFDGYMEFPINAGRYDNFRIWIATGDPDNQTDAWDAGDRLLYPSDFRRCADFVAGYPNLLNWFLGVLLQSKISNSYYIKTSDTNLLAAYNDNRDSAFFESTFPSAGSGTYYIVPILAQTAQTAWGNTQLTDSILLIDGYRSELSFDANKTGFRVYPRNDSPRINGNNTEIDLRVINAWTSQNAVNKLYIYVVSEGVFDSSDWDTVREVVEGWSDEYDDTYYGGNGYTPTDIKNSSGKVIARCYDILQEMTNAHGSRYLPGGTAVDWTKVLSGITADGLGNPYNKWSEICFCAQTSLDVYISET